MKVPRTQQEKEARWRKIINAWKANGEQQINQFCIERKIATSSFYQWRNRLFPKLKVRKKTKTKTKSSSPAILPVEITLAQKHQSQGLTLCLPNGCSVTLNRDFDVETLTKLIKMLGG